MRIGILGGSFDPVHHGHLGVARAVADALHLGQVLLMPAAQAPLRDNGVRASGDHRVNMLNLALVGLTCSGQETRFSVDATELRRGGISYTADTLRALHAAHPDDELVWIIGADQLARLAQWREPAELARLASWAAYVRPGYDWEKAPPTGIPGLRVHRIEPGAGALWDISSSAIRARLARRECVRGLLPDKVIEYIHENGLYRPQ